MCYCKICNKEVGSYNKHFKKKHFLTYKEYYDLYEKSENEGKCIICGNDTKFSTKHKKRYAICCENKECYKLYYSNKFKLWWKTTDEKTIIERNKKISNSNKNLSYEKQQNKTKGLRTYFDNLSEKELENRRLRLQEIYKNENRKKEINNKRKTTYKNNTGFENPAKNPDIIDKIKETKFKEHSDENWNNRDKYKETCLNNYGVESTNKLDTVKYKKEQTCLIHFNVTNPSKSYQIRQKQRSKYTFENINFDSKPEIAYYIWLKDHNIEFEYQPDIPLEYEYNGKIRTYNPDFKVGDEIIEIKGLQFFKNHDSNNIMINPYKRNKYTPEELKLRDGLMEAKHQCMINNHVKIITDYSYYIKYVKTKYGTKYLNNTKNKKS